MDGPLPDNFDAAYHWFCSQLHDIKFEGPPLLDEQENELFSNLFDRVLVEPQHSQPQSIDENSIHGPACDILNQNSRVISSNEPQGMPERRREVMTAEQVKHNHLVSERRRRDHVKLQFDEIQSLVPSLQDEGVLPRSIVLRRIYEYTRDLAEQNENIRKRLEAIDVDTSEIQAYKLAPPLPDHDSD